MRLVTISKSILPGKSVVSVQNSPASQKRTIALIGPPNSGKSTLFNRLTMLNQKIANYPGVTVEHRMGKLVCADTSEIELVDLRTLILRCDSICRRIFVTLAFGPSARQCLDCKDSLIYSFGT